MKCIFSIAPMESLEKSWEHSPDTGLGGTGRCSFLARGVGSTEQSASDDGQALLARPVMDDISSENASASTGCSRSIWWCESGDPARLTTSLCMGPVSTERVWCSINFV